MHTRGANATSMSSLDPSGQRRCICHVYSSVAAEALVMIKCSSLIWIASGENWYASQSAMRVSMIANNLNIYNMFTRWM